MEGRKGGGLLFKIRKNCLMIRTVQEMKQVAECQRRYPSSCVSELRLCDIS